MAVYTVHIPRSPAGQRLSPDAIVFLRDGFSAGAFFFGPLWLASRRAWIPALLWTFLLIALAGVGSALGLSRAAISILELAASIILGFEGAPLVAWSLARRGYAESAVQVADNIDEAEDVFFHSWRPDASMGVAVPPRASGPGGGAAAPGSHVIGGLHEGPRQ